MRVDLYREHDVRDGQAVPVILWLELVEQMIERGLIDRDRLVSGMAQHAAKPTLGAHERKAINACIDLLGKINAPTPSETSHA